MLYLSFSNVGRTPHPRGWSLPRVAATTCYYPHRLAAASTAPFIPTVMRSSSQARCIGISIVAHSSVQVVGMPATHVAASDPPQQAAVTCWLYSRNSGKVSHGAGGGGHVATAASIVVVIPTVAKNSRQACCIGNNTSAHSTLHDDGMPPAGHVTLGLEQQAAVTAFE